MNKIKDKVPYPSDWKVKKLGELGPFLKGKGISKSETKESGLPCIRYGEIYTRHHNYIKEFYSFIDEETAKNSTRIRKGDILFAGSGETMEEIGKSVAFLHEEQAYAGGDIIILRTKDVDSQYLAFALNEGRLAKERAKLGQGHSVVHIYPKELKELIIHLPSKNEQQKIASILSTWDKAIELKEKLIEQKKEQKKGLMQKLLTGEVRLPGFNDNWDKKCLEDICEQKGLVRGPFGGALKKEYFVEQGYKVYEQKNAIYKDITLGEYYIDENKFTELKRFEVHQGDFIVSCSGTIGRIYRIPNNSPKGVINQALLKIRIDNKVIDSEYFYQYFQWERFQNKIIENTQGGAMQNLVGMNIFRKTRLSIPTLLEQKKIAQILYTLDKEIDLQERELLQKKEQKKGLMQLLLTGKVRVKV